MTPAHNHLAMPEAVLLGMVAVALLWQWDDMALPLLLGFLGLLRPAEIVKLTFGDFVLPSRTLDMVPVLFVKIGHPKNRRLAAKREHVRFDDAPLVSFAEAFAAGRHPDAPLLNGNPVAFQACFRALLAVFGIPWADGTGLTAASLRPGGATFWYRCRDSPD